MYTALAVAPNKRKSHAKKIICKSCPALSQRQSNTSIRHNPTKIVFVLLNVRNRLSDPQFAHCLHCSSHNWLILVLVSPVQKSITLDIAARQHALIFETLEDLAQGGPYCYCHIPSRESKYLLTLGPTHFAYWFRVWAIVVCLSKLNKLQILIQLFRPWLASCCQAALELIPKCEMDTPTCPYSPRLLKPGHGYAFLVRHPSP